MSISAICHISAALDINFKSVKLPHFLKLKVLSCFTSDETTHSTFSGNYLAAFHLW